MPNQVLISLPPAMAHHFDRLEGKGPGFYAACDPVPLGSGGGTANLLVQAWRQSDFAKFEDWLDSGLKIVVHSGGQSRRLPAYAAVGKALIPVPIERGSVGQKFDQSLLDLQLESIQPVLDAAPASARVAILSGDVLLKILSDIPRIPECDIACLGFSCPPTTLAGFGAFFSSWSNPDLLDFMLQKPAPAETQRLSRDKKCLADAGVWLLGADALAALMEQAGWNFESSEFETGTATFCDLYGGFGLGLGSEPTIPSPQSRLKTVVFEPQCSFFHFGTSRQVVEAMTQLHSLANSTANSRFGFTTTELRQPDQHVQNVNFEGGQHLTPHAALWIENSHVSSSTTFEGENFLTGLPQGPWDLHFRRGACLDLAPIGENEFCCRFYGYDDSFSGTINSDTTCLMGEPAGLWFARRGLGSKPFSDLDIQDAPMFPVVDRAELTDELLEWLLQPDPGDKYSAWFRTCPKLSARDLLGQVNLDRIYAQRRALGLVGLEKVFENRDRSAFYTMDLKRAAGLASKRPDSFALDGGSRPSGPARVIREEMFLSELARVTGKSGWQDHEDSAFRELAASIVRKDRLSIEPPRSTVLPEQIVWGRSPVRFDLAGGWTDTPPYTQLHGGRVVNVAVELNGQPPVQVFGRLTESLEISLRSIDLGSHSILREFGDLESHGEIGSEFALAKTALSLAGFGPAFNTHPTDSLKDQLRAFGGGLELSMLAAVPKGSGLGTSSILSATLISTIGSICGRNWSEQDIFERVLVSEQILTSGGGWQDQAGGTLPGLKLLSTEPGPIQPILCRWLPEKVIGDGVANVTALLFYTGITRTAKGVLKEIVRGMFLNSHEHLATLSQIGANTGPTVDAIMRNSYSDLGRCVRRSWELNQALDSGTCTPNVERIYRLIDEEVHGAKLLGAGGGGYLLMFCKDADAASRVRRRLSEEVREPGNRFVDFQVSRSGLVVTRS